MTTVGERHEGERLLVGYRTIRRIEPPDAPWAGVLTRMPDGESCIRIDAARLGEDWGGWRAASSGHLLGPLEILRREGGHDVALPVCTERAADFLCRRHALGAPLEAGELVTFAVSLLRGSAELARAELDASAGEWWLTDGGRPVFATDLTTAESTSAAELLEDLAGGADQPLAAVLTDAAASVATARTVQRDIATLEARLFALAAPLPLTMEVFAPLRARALAATTPRAIEPVAQPARRPGWLGAVAGHVDADLAELVSVATTDVWRRWRSRSRGSRRPWLVATGLAAVVVSVGLLWPGGAGGPATADVPVEAVVTPSATAEPTPDDSPKAPSEGAPSAAPEAPSPPVAPQGQGWVTAADELLNARTGCEGDAECLSGVVENPARVFSPGVVDLAPAARSTTLLDDFGGAAVLRVDALADGVAPQLVFVVRVDQRTLLRDIMDVAEQSR